MVEITVPLTSDQVDRLKQLAEQSGISLEEMARAGLEDWLEQSRKDFIGAAERVLQKNAELYRRLA